MAESQKNVSDSVVKPASLVQSSIIMKIDGPSEEPNNAEIDENEQNACLLKNKEEFKTCSSSFRSSTTNTNNPFASSQNKLSRGILKPPQLSLNNSVTAPSNKTFMLKPSQLNPFATKCSDSSDKTNSEKTDGSDKKINQVNGETPKFVPLIVYENKTKVTAPVTSNQSLTTSSTTVSNNAFIFGQNLKERVIAVEAKTEEPKASTSLSSNGTSEMLFSSAIKNEVKADSTTKEKEAKSLSESAREYEESRASKRKYEEVEVITGEEHENNILKISCKLFSFDKATGSWQERGRGTLRLNDFEIDDAHIGSRLVFRTTGSLRVILNTKIWAEMTIDKASDKSIRLTALDASGEIKVFLIMTNIEDSNKLYSHLQTRLEREVTAQKRKKVDYCAESDSGGN